MKVCKEYEQWRGSSEIAAFKKYEKLDQWLRASSLIEVVDKCYVEASKDIMFSIFCQSMAKHLGVDALDES